MLVSTLMLTGCDLAGAVSREEVAAVMSPDGATRAVLFETNGGATTAFDYEIELQPTRDSNEAVAAGELYGASRSECSWGVNLHWLSPTELAIEFMEADRTAIPAQVELGAKSVTLRQLSGVSDKAAPCGGMLANLG